MRWRLNNRTLWHRWFAWHPVQVERQIAWMCWVDRRLVPLELWWEYRGLTHSTATEDNHG